jgi:hypothetical protein
MLPKWQASNCAQAAHELGMRKAEVFVKGTRFRTGVCHQNHPECRESK